MRSFLCPFLQDILSSFSRTLSCCFSMAYLWRPLLPSFLKEIWFELTCPSESIMPTSKGRFPLLHTHRKGAPFFPLFLLPLLLPPPPRRIFMAQKAANLSFTHSLFTIFRAKAVFEMFVHVLLGYWKNSASCIIVPKPLDSVLQWMHSVSRGCSQVGGMQPPPSVVGCIACFLQNQNKREILQFNLPLKA